MKAFSAGSQAVSDAVYAFSASMKAAAINTFTEDTTSSYIVQVEDKLKRFYADKEDVVGNRIKDEAIELTDPDRIFEKFIVISLKLKKYLMKPLMNARMI